MGKQEENNMLVRKPNGEELRFKLLNTLEFNSTRKRMSVVIKDMQTNEILLLSKGADSIMLPLISDQDQKMKDKT